MSAVGVILCPGSNWFLFQVLRV